jgi:hypothetical protein
MELHNNWMPDGEEIVKDTSPWRWIWVLVGVILTIVCLFIYESQDPLLFDLHRRFTRMDAMYLEGLLFDNTVPITDSGHTDKTHYSNS